MRAKVKADYRWDRVRACAGAEFIKGEFRPVPDGLEEEALQAEMLEIESEPVQPAIPPGEQPETAQMVEPVVTRRERKPK